jgi:hypothetical protein
MRGCTHREITRECVVEPTRIVAQDSLVCMILFRDTLMGLLDLDVRKDRLVEQTTCVSTIQFECRASLTLRCGMQVSAESPALLRGKLKTCWSYWLRRSEVIKVESLRERW